MSLVRRILVAGAVALSLASCLKPAARADRPSNPIEACLAKLDAGDRASLAALETTILKGSVFVRSKELVEQNDKSVELFDLYFKDGLPRLAVFSSIEALGAALGDGPYVRFKGRALSGWNAKTRIVLNYGSNSVVEWEIGEFGRAAAEFPATRGCS